MQHKTPVLADFMLHNILTGHFPRADAVKESSRQERNDIND
jgi:hypothetical protein